MRKCIIGRKALESRRRDLQDKYNELRETRKRKKMLWKVITWEDYHPLGHIRHWKKDF